MKRNLAEEKVEPVLPLHAVWNKHKEIKLMDAEPAVKGTWIIWVWAREARTQWKTNVLTIIDKNLHINHMVLYILTVTLSICINIQK